MPNNVKKWTKKRRFRGNRYTKSNQSTNISSVATKNCEINNVNIAGEGTSIQVFRPRPSSPLVGTDSETKRLSASSVKLDKICDKLTNYDDKEEESQGFRIIDLKLLRNALKYMACCRFCGSGDIDIKDNISNRCGLASQLIFCCVQCNEEFSFRTSDKAKGGYEVNIRYTYAMRCIGKGQRAMDTVCAILNLPPPTTNSTERYGHTIGSVCQEVAESSMKNAAEEVISESGSDIRVSVDGTWRRRGHTSLHGVVTAIERSSNAGKVVDVDVLSKFCHGCVRAKKNNTVHKRECDKNYMGTSGGMEVEGAVKMFKRSEEKLGLRYIQYLGDGDCKSFQAVQKSEPYEGVTLEKLECIGHIQKRAGAQLRKVVSDMKAKGEGRLIQGKGKLTSQMIDNIQNYYGMAIRNNCDSAEKMKIAVWAIYFHLLSTDEHPQHELCPSGASSWCKFNCGKVTGKEYSHKNVLPKEILVKIKPVFQRLSDPQLLAKCVHGKTQNVNEALNQLIWMRCPKENFSGLSVLKAAVYDAVGVYNDGGVFRKNVLVKLGIECGVFTERGLRAINAIRLRMADIKVSEHEKQARKTQKRQKKAQDNKNTKKEGDPVYCSGSF